MQKMGGEDRNFLSVTNSLGNTQLSIQSKGQAFRVTSNTDPVAGAGI